MGTTLFLNLLFLILINLFAVETKAADLAQTLYLNMCDYEKLGCKIKCNPDWEVQTKDLAVMMIIKRTEKELVSLTIARSNEEVPNLGKLTRPILSTIGSYEDHFTPPPRQAISVKDLGEMACPWSGFRPGQLTGP